MVLVTKEVAKEAVSMTTDHEATDSTAPKERALRTPSRMKRTLLGASLVGMGLAGGGYLAAGPLASAATNANTTKAAANASTTHPHGRPLGAPPSRMALSKTGTVTAVGTASVTIGGTVYAVDSSSDIDKNGKAALSDLAVGDAVRFSTVTTSGVVTVAVLHAGSEALDRPAGPPGRGASFAPPA